MQKNVCSKESCASITLYLCPVCSTFSWLKLHLKTWIWCFLPEPGDNHSIYNLNVICVVAWSCPGNRCEVGKFLWSTQVTSDELFSGWECSLIRSPDKVLGMSVVEWMGLFESVVGCVIWMTVVTWAVRCLRPCVVGSMSECVVMCVVGWVGAGWLWSWLTDGMTVCWLTSECLRGVWGRVWLGPWVNVWLCVWWDEWELADCGLDWLMGWLCVDWPVSVWGVSEAVCGWVHEWMCGYVCGGMSGSWLIVVLTDWWDDCVLTDQWVSEGCLRPCVVGSMSECVYVCGGSWLTVVLTDWWDDCVLTVQWGVWGVSEAVCGWVHEWMCLCVWWELADCGLDWLMGWLCVDCAVRCPRGVWGSVWLGPWVSDVCGGMCGWTDGMTVCWLCSEVSEGCLRQCVVGSMSECVVGCGRVSGGCLFGSVSGCVSEVSSKIFVKHSSNIRGQFY